MEADVSAYRDPPPPVPEAPAPKPPIAGLVAAALAAVMGFAFFAWSCWHSGSWPFVLSTGAFMIALQGYRHYESTPRAQAKRRLRIEKEADRLLGRK